MSDFADSSPAAQAPNLAPKQTLSRWPQRLLSLSAKFWFVIAAIGQWLFVYYILLAYGPRTASGNFASWDETGLIEGYTQGDWLGNLGFISHVLLAVIVMGGGTMQLVPALRKRFPAVHRWTGRTYLAVAVFMAVGGIALTWVRGSRLNDIGALGTTIDGILILVAAAFALRFAIARRIDTHRRWAMRLFIFASGVWFTRVGYMGWAMLTGGAGISRSLDGPFDLFIAYGSWAVPWLILELYMRACDSRSAGFKLAMTGVVTAGALFTAVGVFGAWMMMWSPHI